MFISRRSHLIKKNMSASSSSSVSFTTLFNLSVKNKMKNKIFSDLVHMSLMCIYYEIEY